MSLVANLTREGHLVPPKSRAEARRRLYALRREINKISRHLVLPENAPGKGRDNWRARALQAKVLFEREERLLRAWVLSDQGEAKLATDLLDTWQEALTVMKSLRDEVEDLTDREMKALDWLVKKLEAELGCEDAD